MFHGRPRRRRLLPGIPRGGRSPTHRYGYLPGFPHDCLTQDESLSVCRKNPRYAASHSGRSVGCPQGEVVEGSARAAGTLTKSRATLAFIALVATMRSISDGTRRRGTRLRGACRLSARKSSARSAPRRRRILKFGWDAGRCVETPEPAVRELARLGARGCPAPGAALRHPGFALMRPGPRPRPLFQGPRSPPVRLVVALGCNASRADVGTASPAGKHLANTTESRASPSICLCPRR